MKKLLSFLAGLVPVLALGATITATELATLNSGGSITLQGPSGSVTVSPPPPPVVTPGATFTVYANGVFSWPGDYSYAASINYKDTAGAPTSGTMDISVAATQWGAWQPFATNWDFDLTPYNYLSFDLKPTQAGASWHCFALMVGDKPITDVNGNGIYVNVSSYGPAPIVGKWATYKIPLAAIMTNQGVRLEAMYKFDIQDQSGLSSNTFYVNNVKFTAN